jgi:hypothetical protein
MSRVGFEPTITVFEQAKVFRALGRAATVTGNKMNKNVHFQANLFTLTHVIYKVVISRRMRWVGSGRRRQMHTQFLSVHLRGRDLFGDLDVDD